MDRLRLSLDIVRTVALVLIATTLFLWAGRAGGQSAFEPPSSLNQAAQEALSVQESLAWSVACEYMKAKCDVYIMPYVGYGLLRGQLGTYQYGSRTVLVDIRMIAQPMGVLTLIHEMIHYLQWATSDDALPITQETACAREKEAYDLVWLANGALKLVDPEQEKRLKTWDSIRYRYPGCGTGPKLEGK